MTAHTNSQGKSWCGGNQMRAAPWLFLAPGIAFFALYVIIPIVQSFHISPYR